MFEGLERRETVLLGGVLLAAVAVSFVAGSYTSGTGVTGNIAASSGSEQAVRDAAQQMIDQQMQRQQQQLQQVASQSPNISADDLSMDASVSSVEQSQFGSLYKVTVSISGTVPSRLGSGTRQVDQEQELYFSPDGRYMFQPPTDLQQPQQPTQRQPGGGGQAPQPGQ